MLNTDNLVKFRDYLETLHDADLKDDFGSEGWYKIEESGFNMASWEDECGTPCCIGGHLLSQNKGCVGYYGAAEKVFGLSASAAANLFLSGMSTMRIPKLSDAVKAIQFLIDNPAQENYSVQELWGK